MKKSMLLLVPFLMLVGCGINGLNPFGLDDVNGNASLATLSVQVLGPDKAGLDYDELPIIRANFTLIDVDANNQTTNWVPSSSTFIKFKSVRPGLCNLTLADIDNLGMTNTTNINMLVRAGYNYRILATLGGSIYLIETNASAALAYRYEMIYSETHNDTNIWAKGATLFAWNTSTLITEQTNNLPPDGNYNFRIIKPLSATNWMGLGFTETNGVKDNSIYTSGHLKFCVRNTLSSNTYKIGVSSVNGTTTNEVFITLDTIAGYSADGNWKYLSVPMSDFVGVDFTKIYTYFELASVTLNTNVSNYIDLDDIYWSRD